MAGGLHFSSQVKNIKKSRSGNMEECSKKTRKVRFKLASSYSGRVLKHVYEDGQELDSPEEKYPHSFIHTKIPQHLDVEQLCSFEEVQGQDVDPPAGLIAQRINVYRAAPVLDFEKIIIYTSNLKIIRSPSKRAESGVRYHHSRGDGREVSPGRESRSKGRHRTKSARKEERLPAPKEEETGGCEQCGGSGTAPCSLCHGSKLSMLANRFNESIRELRCPACDPHGLQPLRSGCETYVKKEKRQMVNIAVYEETTAE